MTLNENVPSACLPKWFWWAFGALVAAGVALRVALYAYSDFSVGDAFISYRFAEQFAAGHGLVFNTGEVVGGNTSVLHSLLVGLGALTGAAVPVVAHVEGIAFDALALFFLWNILRGPGGLRSPGLQLFALAAIFFCPLLFWFSVNGLETTLYLLLVFFLFDRTLKPVDWHWYLAVALLFFCRPDGVVPVAAALLCLWMARKKIPWTEGFGVFFIGLAYLAFNYAMYHSAIPPTVRIKSIVYHSTPLKNFAYIADRFFFHRTWLLGVYCAALLAAMAWSWRRVPAVRLLGIGTFLFLLFLLTAPMMRTWYCAPFLALSGVALLLAGGAFAEEKNVRGLNWAVALLLAAYLAAGTYGYKVVFKDCRTWRERIRVMTQAEGEWLKANTPPDAKVLVESLEVGWFSKRHTWDWPGLVSPPVTAMIKANPDVGFFEIGNRLRVNYVIIHEGWNRSDDTNVPPNYTLIRHFKTVLAGDAVYINPGSDLLYQRAAD